MHTILEHEGAQVSKRTRRGGPKSRHGCPTCKIRHVKCDQTRPFCMRCIDTGRKCEGFPGDPKKSVLTFVLPSTQLSFALAAASPLSESEAQHLNAFRHFFVRGMSRYSSSSRWETLMLQAMHQEPSVQYAAIAFSALQMPDWTDQISQTSHRTNSFAIQQYGKSIKEFSKLLTLQDRHSIEAALLCSILCISFEVLEGSHTIANLHLHNGLQLVNSVEVDEEISRVFTRLDIQASAYVGGRVPSRILRFQPLTTVVFGSIDDAEQHLFEELNQVWAFYRGTENEYRRQKTSPVPIEVFAEAQSINERLRQWKVGLDSFSSAAHSLSNIQTQHTLLLQLHYHTAMLLMAGALCMEEIIYDAFDRNFETIINLSEIFLANDFETPAIKTFSIEMGVVYSLFVTALKCRITSLREKSIQLLRTVPHFEGVWNSQVLVKVCERVKDIEEEGLEPSILETSRVPEVQRVHMVELDIDQKSRKSGLLCKLKPNGLDADWQDIEDIVTW